MKPMLEFAKIQIKGNLHIHYTMFGVVIYTTEMQMKYSRYDEIF